MLYYYIENLKKTDEKLLLQKAEEHLSSQFKGEVMTLTQHWEQRGIEQGFEKGAKQKERQIAINMLKKGIEAAAIAELTGLSLKEVLGLNNEMVQQIE